MRIVPVFLLALLVSTPLYAVGPEADLKAAIAAEIDADPDVDVTEEVEPRALTQPGLRECTLNSDCTLIEGVCEPSEPVNVERANAKQETNRKARLVSECPERKADDKYGITGAACIENECVITKRRL
jgi:hypothetical protein